MRAKLYTYGPRSTLKPGDRFRVSGGPFWTTAAGNEVSMRARGVMTFVAAVTAPDGMVYLEARSDKDGDVILHVEGERKSPVEGLTPRPYRIVSKLRK